MRTFTKAEKNAHFEKLRKLWNDAAEFAKDEAALAAHAEAKRMGVEVSIRSFCLVSEQMKSLNLQGTPYIDTKTFNGWTSAGFKVKKGERSKLSSIVFIGAKDSDADDDGKKSGYVFPKECHLFHVSQVEPITL